VFFEHTNGKIAIVKMIKFAKELPGVSSGCLFFFLRRIGWVMWVG
jgi:hypothetical protein